MDPPPAPVTPITKKQVANPPWGALGSFSGNIMEMQYGPGDGSLYVLDYGSAFYAKNASASLKKITYKGCLPPVSLVHSRKQLSPKGGLLAFTGPVLTPPFGTRKVQVFDLAGKKVFEREVSPVNPGQLRIPVLGSDLVWVAYLP
jgi:hypothetical protein